MSYMFDWSYSISSLDLSSFDTSNVTNMSHMFATSCDSHLDLSNFDTSNVTDMSYMFRTCNFTSLDISSFNTSKVENMVGMFEDCDKLESLNLSNFNVENIEDMTDLFYGCENLKTVDLTGFKTSNVKVMAGMFAQCAKLKMLNLTNFDTANVEDFCGMFACDERLETIYASNDFKVQEDSYSGGMFKYASSLKGDNGTTYTPYVTDGTYARLDGGKKSPGYFSSASKISVSIGTTNYTYDGKVKSPNIVVKCGQSILTQGKDYTVSYSGDRKSVGIHKVVIKGVGAYNSSVTKSFVINPKGIALKSVATGNKALTVKWAKSSKANASGYQIQIAKNKKFSKGKKTVNAKGCKAVSKKISKLNSGKKYFVKVRAYKTVGGKIYYSAWSKVLSKKTK